MTRGEVVAKARELVGRDGRGRPAVRFRHQGRDPRSGLDCAGVLVWVAHELGHLPDVDYIAYARYPARGQLRSLLDLHLARRSGPGIPEPGDCLLFSQGVHRCPMHVAIATDSIGGWRGLGIVHAWARARGVVETRFPEPGAWDFRLRGTYCFRPLVASRSPDGVSSGACRKPTDRKEASGSPAC